MKPSTKIPLRGLYVGYNWQIGFFFLNFDKQTHQAMQQTLNETRQIFGEIYQWADKLDEMALLTAPAGKWNSAQQLLHLTISQKATNVAYTTPGFAVSLLYGKSKTGSRTYDGVVAAYQALLAQGAKSTKEYEPNLSGDFNKAQLLQSYSKHGELYLSAVAAKADKELDTLQVKHPLLGKLTLRELAYFTLYHNRHHFKSMKALV